MTDDAWVDRRARFRELHREGLFVMPNAWDIGSARLLASARVRGDRDDELGARGIARAGGSGGQS